jgi:hypothetical protein
MLVNNKLEQILKAEVVAKFGALYWLPSSHWERVEKP